MSNNSYTFTVGLIGRVIEVVRKDIDPRLEAQTFDMLIRIASQPGIAQVVLAEQVGISGAAISRAVEKLVELELVHRYEDPKDRRWKLARLTSKGQRVVKRFDEEVRKHLEQTGWQRKE